MPPLVAFGTKWEIGSDDFVYPGIRSLLIRIPWLVGTIVVTWINYDKVACSNGGDYVQIFSFGAIGIVSLMICGDLLLIYNSSRGGVMNTQARRFVPLCLYAKVGFYMVELGWNFLGTYGYVQGIFNCKKSPDTAVFIICLIICNWILLIFFLSLWLWQYDPLGKSKTDGHVEIGDPFGQAHGLQVTTRTSQWERRLKFIFCAVRNDGRSEAIQKIYKEAAGWCSYLFQNKDLVFSDAIAGTTLLCLKTGRTRKKPTENPPPSSLTSSINFDPTTKSIQLLPSEDWNSVSSILHFLNYALVSFHVPITFICCFGKSLGGLCAKTQWCNSLPWREIYPIHVEKDDCCYWKTACLRTFMADEDIVYASYDNADFCCPFFVALDHSTKSIVIVVRGSYSFVDYLVDCDFTPVPMDIKGVPAEFKAHGGLLKVAKTIKKRLDRLELLTTLTHSHPEYKIMITGLSLGAGVSAILSIILRQEFPTVKCLAFSVLGCTVSLDAAEYCNEFVSSVVYGDDLVPRLGIPSFNQAINKIQSILHTSQTPKYQIQMRLGCSIFGIGKQIMENISDDESIPDEVAVEQGLLVGQTSQEYSSIGSNVLQDTSKCSPEKIRADALERFRLFSPGKILHVTPTPLFDTKRAEDAEAQIWEIKSADRTDFNEIIFSNRMLADHIPYQLISALKYLSSFNTKDNVVTEAPIKIQK